MAKVSTKPTRKGCTRSLYFPDEVEVDALAALIQRFPRATLSSVLAQLIGPLHKQIAKADPDKGQRTIVLNNQKVWL